ncbi:Hypothetical protein DPCES_5375 [Desulfitobacterium hafniense]|uniref:Uncharacterized protein n=1 Tax=Desulfitobacterium hafniense TaxID=49338 RepID=A0A098AUX8_DESHA|nr:hypothetical protein [Desulfitobacterium hafniense]CDV96373.1 Hypothetical protein DPCES_5375 [Desulfitobacterium hafniense]
MTTTKNNPPVRQHQTGQTEIHINPSIAQKRLSDIIFDADACALNPTFAELRKWLRVGDFEIA